MEKDRETRSTGEVDDLMQALLQRLERMQQVRPKCLPAGKASGGAGSGKGGVLGGVVR